MNNSKLIDCVTFFDNKLMFDLRFNILKDYVDFFVVCESKFDHRNNPKKLNFDLKFLKDNKVKYVVLDKPFPNESDIWKNQAIQREFLLNSLDSFVMENDFVFFSDPDEIPNPSLFINFSLKKKYGIFFQNCFNFKFNLYNPFETPWEGTRVSQKKNLKSIDFMRQKVKSKNLKYNFLRFDKEKNIELFNKSGWHFNNMMSPKEISIKLKTFAHSEFSIEKFSNEGVISSKIQNHVDLFERGHKYVKIVLDNSFPDFITKNKEKFSDWII